MRALIQRVTQASVSIDNSTISEKAGAPDFSLRYE